MTYLTNETGAVTVDWVVLTAALVGLGLATMGVVSSGVEDLSGDTRDEMGSQLIRTSFDQWTYDRLYEITVQRGALHGDSPLGTQAQTLYDVNVGVLTGDDDAALLARANAFSNQASSAQTRLAALDALDPETATLAEIATAVGRPEAGLQSMINAQPSLNSAQDVYQNEYLTNEFTIELDKVFQEEVANRGL